MHRKCKTRATDLLMAAALLAVLVRTARFLVELEGYGPNPRHPCCEFRAGCLVEHALDRHDQYKAEGC